MPSQGKSWPAAACSVTVVGHVRDDPVAQISYSAVRTKGLPVRLDLLELLQGHDA